MSIHPAHQKQLTVGAQRLEVMLKDGTSVTLHPVFDRSVPELYLRALRLPAGMVLMFDLRDLVKQIEADLCTARGVDVPGTVFFSLRQAFTTAELLVREICAHGRPVVQQLEAA